MGEGGEGEGMGKRGKARENGGKERGKDLLDQCHPTRLYRL